MTDYAFDGLSRLASLTQNLTGTAQDLTLGFTYNPAGQITKRTSTNPVFDAGLPADKVDTYVPNGLNQIDAVNAVMLGYDGRGNLTSDERGLLYAYDADNRLTNVNTGAGGAVGLSYDPAGPRAKARKPKIRPSDFVYVLNYNHSGPPIYDLPAFAGGWAGSMRRRARR